MPKIQIVDPKVVRQPSILKIKDIPINQYKGDIKAEVKKYGKEKLVRIFHTMATIREFETMLNLVKTQGGYNGVDYNHKGPAHLSIGQEASSTGQSFALNVEDYTFGSHRSHGEIISKCFAAVSQLPDEELTKVMKNFWGGETLKVAEKAGAANTKELADDFVLYGALAEIFAKAPGFHRGLGGSMHAFFAPFGMMPNNALVGGSADIATGAALYKRINGKPGIVVSNIGDAAMGCGPVWEAMMLAAMDQYRTLWGKDAGGAPPILFNFFNNFYGMGGQTFGETMPYQVLARVGAGVNPDNMHAERVDGYNPLAVLEAVERKKKILLAGEGPVLMDTITYRLSGHSPSDASSYRTKEEIEMWENADCVKSYGEYLVEGGVLKAKEVADIRAKIGTKMNSIYKLAIDMTESPRLQGGAFIESVMFSNTKADKLDDRAPEVLLPLGTDPRSVALKGKARYALDADGKALPKAKIYAYRDGLFEAMLHRFYIDPTMAAWGEENRDWGGAFAVYRGLTEALPYKRLFNSSISEGAIVGSGVGYALCGGRAVVELMYCDFMGRAGDEIFNQMAKWQSMSAGLLKMPLVLRVAVGAKYGAQHSQDWSALVAHIPGLKAYFPATPTDAKGMLNLALRGTDPVVFFESQGLYDMGEIFEKSGVPEGFYETPEGEPAVRKTGKDLTIVTLGATLYKAMDAAKILQTKYGIDAEVIDLRFISPLKYDVLIESVKKTGKVLLASDAVERGNYLHTVASTLTQVAFNYLDAPVAVVGSRNFITPAAEMEDVFFPQTDWIIDTIHERIVPLAGHVPTTVQTGAELLRRNKLGL